MKNLNDFSRIIINLNTTLLVIFLGFIFINKGKSENETVFAVATLIILITSLGLNYWHTFRFRRRSKIFSQKMKVFADTSFRHSLEADD